MMLSDHKLFIITNEHMCCGGINGYVNGIPPEEICSKYKYGQQDPRHFKCWEVEEIIGPDAKGAYIARSITGNCWTYGYEEDLIKRLTQYVPE